MSASGRSDPATVASLLVEALPYIREFSGNVVVIKYGGNALAASADEPGDSRRPGTGRTLATFAQDVVLLRSVGILPVVVHGGGPQIGEMMRRLGKEVEFRDGLRVTDAETLDIARMVLVGKVNREIVSAINVHAPLAVGPLGRGRPPHHGRAALGAARLRRRHLAGRPDDGAPACCPRG